MSAADGSNNDVEPQVFDAESEFEGGILKSGDAGIALGVVELGKSLPEMPRRVEQPFATDDLFRSALLIWRDVH